MPPSVAPSPWPSASVTPRANVVVRNSDKVGGVDGKQPVFVCDLPQQLRSSQRDAESAGLQGGMDGKSGLSWVLRGSHGTTCAVARAALNKILEHGEKLASMVAPRELNNTRSQPKSTSPTMLSQYNAGDLSGAIWDMIQLVGDKARRNKGSPL